MDSELTRDERSTTGIVECRDTRDQEWVTARDGVRYRYRNEFPSGVRRRFTEWVSQKGEHVSFGRFVGSAAELAFVREHIDGQCMSTIAVVRSKLPVCQCLWSKVCRWCTTRSVHTNPADGV